MIIPLLISLMVTIFLVQIPIPNFSFGPVNYILRSFFHGNSYHLLANLFSLWQLNSLTKQLGTKQFSQLLAFLLITSSLILYTIHTLFPDTKVTTIGFSGVLFGLIIVTNFLVSGNLISVSGEAILQILPQFFVPGISFWGHLSGIISGIIYLLFKGKTISPSMIV